MRFLRYPLPPSAQHHGLLMTRLRNVYYTLALIVALFEAANSQEVAIPSVPRPTVAAYRLLFESEVTPEGLVVVGIQPDSPVLRMLSAETPNLGGVLEFADIIAAVDGQPIQTIEDYHRVMDASAARNGRVELTVLDRNTRQPHRWVVQARKIQVPVLGQPEAARRKAHFLMVGLTDDPKIGEAMEDTLELWQGPIASIDSERHGNIRIVKGAECRANKILEAVSQMEVAARDTMFCVYCGHGAHSPSQASPDDPSRGHHFQIKSGDLMRKSLYDAMIGKGARLTVLISDTCNIEDIARPALQMYAEERTTMVMGLSPFEQLLFNYRGVVDISGTDFGEYGFCQPGYGSWFSASALPVLQLHSDWRSAFEQVQRVVDTDFQQRRLLNGISQARMTPKAFRLDVYRDEPVVALADSEPPKVKEFSYRVRKAARP